MSKKNTKLELDIKFSGKFKSRGCSTVFSSTNYETSVFSLNFGSSQYYQFYCWIDKPDGKGGQVNILERLTDEMKMNRNTIIFQSGLATYAGLSKNISTKTTDNDISLILFGNRVQDGTMCIFNAYNMYVYGLKLYEGDVLKRDYIPVLDYKGRASLYEKVQGKFYYNQGTGEFLYG